MRTPKLKQLDLRKIWECDHPDIRHGVEYLVKYDGTFYCGHFTKLWYGWNFSGIYDAGAQLDYSEFEGIWQIMR